MGIIGTHCRGDRKSNRTRRELCLQLSRLTEIKKLRCYQCGKLLAEKASKGTVIVCYRCKARNEV